MEGLKFCLVYYLYIMCSFSNVQLNGTAAGSILAGSNGAHYNLSTNSKEGKEGLQGQPYPGEGGGGGTLGPSPFFKSSKARKRLKGSKGNLDEGLHVT